MVAWGVIAMSVVVGVALRELRRRRSADTMAMATEVEAGAVRPMPSGMLPILKYARDAESRSILPVFAAATICGFTAWLGAQMLFAGIAPPRMPINNGTDPTTFTWQPIELATLMLLAGACGWIATFSVLRYARMTREAGYTSERLLMSLLQGFVGIMVAIPIVFWTAELTLAMWDRLRLHHADKHPLLESMDQSPDGAVIAIAALAAVVAAPLFEELIFRGLIQNGIVRATHRPWLGVLVASALFALIHPWWTMPPIFVLSLLLGIVYQRSQNLWAVTLMHALFNAFAMATSSAG